MPKSIGEILSLNQTRTSTEHERTLSHMITHSAIPLQEKNKLQLETTDKKRKLHHGDAISNIEGSSSFVEEDHDNRGGDGLAATNDTNGTIQQRLSKSKTVLFNVMDRIINDEPLDHSLVYLYRLAESVCKYKHSEMKELSDILIEKLERKFNDLTSLSDDRDKVDFNDDDDDDDQVIIKCQNFINKWKVWQTCFTKMAHVFYYLDTYYLMPHHFRTPIAKYATDKFANFYFPFSSTPDSLYSMKQTYLALVKIVYKKSVYFRELTDEGEGDGDDNGNGNSDGKGDVLKLYHEFTLLYQDLTQFLNIALDDSTLNKVDLAVIQKIEETISLTHIIEDLDTKDKIENDQLNAPDNALKLAKVFQFLKNEARFYNRCSKSKLFIQKLISQLSFKLIFGGEWEELVDREFDLLIESPEEVRMLIKYCREVYHTHGLMGISRFAYSWLLYCKKTLDVCINDYRKGVVNIDEWPSFILYGKRILDKLEQQCAFNFQTDAEFREKLNVSFANFVNDEANNIFIIQLMNKFCDTYFKSNFKSYPQMKYTLSFEKARHLVMIYFKALKNKVDFLSVYRREASRRLLLKKSLNVNEEETLVVELVGEVVESEASIALLSMFEDLSVSKSLGLEFSQQQINGIEFEALVLDRKVWPDVSNVDYQNIKIPKEMEQLLLSFDDFYHGKERKLKNRNLDWSSNYRFHKVTISGNFSSGEVSITANMLQAVLIMLFNEQPLYTLEQLGAKSGMNLSLLQAVLNTMNLGKSKIVIQKGDKVLYNLQYKGPPKLKLPMIKEPIASANESFRKNRNNENNNDIISFNDEDNTHKTGNHILLRDSDSDALDILNHNRVEEYKSVLMRILKQESSLDVLDLLNRAIEILQARRPVYVTQLNECLEKLIEQEFLARSGSNIQYLH